MASDDGGHTHSGKVLGLPKPVVVGIGGITAIIVYLWYRQRAAANAATAAATAADATGSGTASGSLAGDLAAAAGATSTTFSTITDWATAVQSWANGNGTDAATTQNALQAYMSGSCLSAAEYAILDKALAQFGAPPDAPSTGLVQCANQPGGGGPSSPAPSPGTYLGHLLTNLNGLVKQGGGWTLPGANQIVTAAGVFQLADGQTAQAHLNDLYWMPSPGVWEKWVPGENIGSTTANPTALYYRAE